MARRSSKRPWGQEHRPLHLSASIARTEVGGDGRRYQVQRVVRAKKEYICPGCGREILVGSEHIVAWPEEDQGWRGVGVEARRHWHTSCWERGLWA